MNEQKKIIIKRLYLNKKPVKLMEIMKFQDLNMKSYAQVQANVFKLHKKGILKRINKKGDYYYYLNPTWRIRHYDWMKKVGII